MSDYKTALDEMRDRFVSSGCPLDNTSDELLVTMAFSIGWYAGRHAMADERIREQMRKNLATVTELRR